MSKKRGAGKKGKGNKRQEDSDEEEVKAPPKGRGGRKQDSDEEEEVKAPPKKRGGRKQASDDEEEEEEKAPPPKKGGKKQQSDEEDEEDEKPAQGKGRGKGKPTVQDDDEETNGNGNDDVVIEEAETKLPTKPAPKSTKKGRNNNNNNSNVEPAAGGGNKRSTATMKSIMADATRAGVKGSVTSQFTVKLDNINLEFSGKHLLEDTSMTLAFGHRYGLVGPNGSGKSTLMRALGRREIGGIPKNIQVLYVEQEVEGAPDKSALDMVVEADTERLELLKTQKELEAKRIEVEAKDEYDEDLQEEITETHKRLHDIGAHSAEHRARVILTGLQFTERMQTCPTQELSGGWRMRIALARSLFCRPHLLLLDEPSNHLDLYACFWLEGFLSKWKKTLLVVSHDVDMLNAICTDIIQLDPAQKKLVQFRGNYDNYLAAADLRRAEYNKAYKKQCDMENEIKRLKNQTQTSQKPKAGKKGKENNNQGRTSGAGSQARAIAKKIEDWEKAPKLPPPAKDYNVKFGWDDPESLPHPVLQVRGVSFTYPGETRQIFKNLELGVDLDLRVAVVGRNGVGKSTLMKIVLGELVPTAGEVIHANKLKIAYFSQHFVDTLPLDISAVDYLRKTFKLDEKEARKYLGRFGITKEQQVNLLSTLSGGQKSRVMFCNLALQNPHIMFLDEPTNHLDIESIEALAEGLRNFKGGVFLITHNQRLIAASCDRVWIVEGNQTVTVWKDEFKEYQKAVMQTLEFDDSDEEN
eukprot:TRINITY_DN3179_c0_g1_i1.p1 TRINITY_DN3179_c0_g1~~TRINITY_DN3179_c0_g1_i1.p1  ORF type:complete len:751 (+),score=276.32 TRINITY_DN3179_c0_g1_i1:132-2384(+)